jgi:cytochrome c
MKHRSVPAPLVLGFLLFGCSSSEKPSAARASVEGKNMMNPVRATPESIASGKKLYEKLCMDCHGEKGDGVSAVAAAMPEGEVKPPNLVDDQWDHGATDGDLFVFIRDGSVGSAAMKGLNGRPGVGATEMWNLVNYVRSLKP